MFPASFLSALQSHIPLQATLDSVSSDHLRIYLPEGERPNHLLTILPPTVGEWIMYHTETESKEGKWVRCHFFRCTATPTGVDLLYMEIFRADTKSCNGTARKSRGIMIAFQGTDGSGKSTIINGLYKNLAPCFPVEQMAYYHCRPFLFQPSKASHGLNMDAVCPDPHSEKPYNKFISLVKLVYCTIDYILGYALRIHRELQQGKLVIFDRYYYDFYLDQQRYRLNLGNGCFRLFETFIPKPDITFVLTGEAEPIWQRKQEIPLEEVRRQIKLLEAHSRHFAHPSHINVTQSIPEVVSSVTRIVLQQLSKTIRHS